MRCSAPLRYWVKCSLANMARQKLMFNDSVATDATVVFDRPCSFASGRPILFRFQIQPAYNRAHLIIIYAIYAIRLKCNEIKSLYSLLLFLFYIASFDCAWRPQHVLFSAISRSIEFHVVWFFFVCIRCPCVATCTSGWMRLFYLHCKGPNTYTIRIL